MYVYILKKIISRSYSKSVAYEKTKTFDNSFQKPHFQFITAKNKTKFQWQYSSKKGCNVSFRWQVPSEDDLKNKMKLQKL